MAVEATGSDKRVERSKAKVLAETYRQLSQNGISGVSIDEICRKSGVAKTTIYRHWPSRSALLIDACSNLGSAPKIPDTGTLRGDLRILLKEMADGLTANWSSVYPSIIDAAERDPEIAEMQAALHKSFMAPLHAVIQRAKTRNEIPAKTVAADLVAALVGPLFFRRWFAKERIDGRFINALIDGAIR
jgi:Transcriptional regulator